jgi:hypothetical protein
MWIHDMCRLIACVPQLFKLYASLVHVLFICLNNWRQIYAYFDFVVIITKTECMNDLVLFW